MYSKKLKLVIKRIITCLMWIVGKIFPYSLGERLRGYRDTMYTIWIRNFIGHVGKDVKIAMPCSLQGGGYEKVSIGDNTDIQRFSVIGSWKNYGNQTFEPSITIGRNCRIGEYNQISACNKITIGDGLLTGRYVYIGDNSHGGLSKEGAYVPPAQRKLVSKGEISIGQNVWIGDKVTILANVHIGDNVIIGANSVVTKDVPSNCIVAGVPAKVIKMINDEE